MLCVKTYLLTKTNEVSEIRRFMVPNGPTFASLSEKIRGVYNMQDTRPLRLQWLDTEGDRVVFSSDTELLDAVSSAEATGDRTLRIYVTEQSRMSDVLHPNVLCDGCEAQVKGYRFKCVICRDFDLCCTCMALNKHCEHPMLLLRKPRDPFSWKCSRWQRTFWSRRPAGEQNESNEQADVCQQVVYEIDKVAKRCATMYSQRFQQQKQQQQHYSAESAQASTCSPGSFSFADCHEAAVAGQEMVNMVHSVSSSLSSILHPLGIDVSYHADDQQQQSQQQSQQQQQQSMESKSTVADIAAEEDAVVVDLAMSDTCESAAPELPDRVATALGQMKAMGFSDDDGQLTQLLLQHDGNIDRVLDAIRQN